MEPYRIFCFRVIDLTELSVDFAAVFSFSRISLATCFWTSDAADASSFFAFFVDAFAPFVAPNPLRVVPKADFPLFPAFFLLDFPVPDREKLGVDLVSPPVKLKEAELFDSGFDSGSVLDSFRFSITMLPSSSSSSSSRICTAFTSVWSASAGFSALLCALLPAFSPISSSSFVEMTVSFESSSFSVAKLKSKSGVLSEDFSE